MKLASRSLQLLLVVAMLVVPRLGAAFAILEPPASAALAGVYPDVPSSSQPVQITVMDWYGGTLLQVLARATNVAWTRDGNTIDVTADLADAQGIAQPPIVVTLPPLPPGRYTVNYDGSHDRPNPERHRTTFQFSVSDAGYVTVVEYFNAHLGHYFITGNPDEMAKLDTGVLSGWTRTGESFRVLAADTAPSYAARVCRYYGLPQAGIDSHFFSESKDECDKVAQNWPDEWILETPAAFATPAFFGAPNVTNTTCSDDGEPLYRLYDNRPDANHRYTTARATRDAMVAQGWILEGYWDFRPIVPGDVKQYGMCVVR